MDPDPLIGATFYFTAKPQVDDAPRGGNGSQVLPVADLADDFDGQPGDGMEYLFLVRREAASHAKVYRASLNPYDDDSARAQARPQRIERIHSSRPSEEWRRAFVEKFKATRFRMATLPPTTATFPGIDLNSIPAPRQESAWRIFINGKRSKPAKPTTPAPRPEPVVAVPQLDIEDRDTDMSDDLESAKAAILASLELDAPEESTSPPPPVRAPRRPRPTSTTTPHAATPVHDVVVPVPVAPSAAAVAAPEFDKLPQLPTPALVAAIPRTSIVHVLAHFTEWFTERSDQYLDELEWVPSTIFAPPALRKKPAVTAAAVAAASVTKKELEEKKKKNEKPELVAPLPTPHECHWILSLVSRLDDLLDGDDLSSLRSLAKALVEMVERSEKAAATAATAGTGRGVVATSASLEEKRRRKRDEEGGRDDEEEARARCWMIVAAIAGVWKQEDLWDVNL